MHVCSRGLKVWSLHKSMLVRYDFIIQAERFTATYTFKRQYTCHDAINTLFGVQVAASLTIHKLNESHHTAQESSTVASLAWASGKPPNRISESRAFHTEHQMDIGIIYPVAPATEYVRVRLF